MLHRLLQKEILTFRFLFFFQNTSAAPEECDFYWLESPRTDSTRDAVHLTVKQKAAALCNEVDGVFTLPSLRKLWFHWKFN